MSIVNPDERCTVLEIMKEKWINIGYKDSPWGPYIEPPPNYADPAKLGLMMDHFVVTKKEICDSLYKAKFNEITATYLLLDHDDNNAHKNSPTSADNNSFLVSKDKSKRDSSHNKSGTGPKLNNSTNVANKDNLKKVSYSIKPNSINSVINQRSSTLPSKHNNTKATLKDISNIYANQNQRSNTSGTRGSLTPSLVVHSTTTPINLPTNVRDNEQPNFEDMINRFEPSEELIITDMALYKAQLKTIKRDLL